MQLLTLLVAAALLSPPTGDLSKAEAEAQAALQAMAAQDHPKARIHQLRALRAAEKALGKDDLRLTRFLDVAAATENIAGNYVATARLYERVVALREKHQPGTAMLQGSLVSLATAYLMRGDERAAWPRLDQARALIEKLNGKRSPEMAMHLGMVASLVQMQNDFVRAESLHREALAIQTELNGVESNTRVNALFQLGWLQLARERFDEAERYFVETLRVLEKDPYPQDTATVTYMESLGRLYLRAGKKAQADAVLDKAFARHQKAVAAARKDPGHGDWKKSLALNLMSAHLMLRERWAEAAAVLEEMVAMATKQHGAGTFSVGAHQMQLAQAYEGMGRIDEARTLFRAARAAEKKFLGAKRASGTGMLMAEFELRQKQFAVAERLYRDLADAYEDNFGPRFPAIAYLRQRQAIATWAQGRPKRAVAWLKKAIDSVEPSIQAVLQSGTESDRRMFLNRHASQAAEAVSLHQQGAPDSPSALALAMSTVLQRKGRLLDAAADSFGALHRRLEGKDKELLEQLLSARGRLSQLVIKGQGSLSTEDYARALSTLEDEVRELETSLARRNARYRAQATPISLAAVKAAVPKDAALVELFVYEPLDPKEPGKLVQFQLVRPEQPARYAAYVLTSDGLRWADLGPAAVIDSGVERLREALADPVEEVQPLARALDALVMAKIRALLGGRTRILLAPDGALNLVPFGALVDEQGDFLVKKFVFAYLTSGRDLLRLQVKAPIRRPPVIIANPRFGDTEEKDNDTAPTRGRRSYDLRSASWTPLPGTEQEAEALRPLLPDASFWTNAEATERAIREAEGPRILHVATHGFFLGDQGGKESAENPLLRSGLALAGANGLRSGEDDGVLTAFEASGLDLWGTRLVVLSACETGVGRVRNGDGVYGLRRALVVAGAETQVMSLWQVDDAATRDLMVGFYRRLNRGTGRADALQQAQTALLQNPETEHPWYWAGFISSGQWAPMEAK